ncbi:SAM-dependent methyltransferase [Moraxella marmotae]|uniref:SAM-dependent methyltransferase n=1 Tax=Moraxella marmotae TaxID=3344520 RepID=UPI0035F28A14
MNKPSFKQDFSHQFARVFDTQHFHAPKNFSPKDVDIIKRAVETNMPLYLEIGAGKGKHAMLFATANPDKHLIAAERTAEKFAAFAKLATGLNLPNLTHVHADAIAFAVHHLPPASLDGVFLLYPNPEPHNKNQRWLNMPFFEFLLSRLKAGASIVLASNITSYIDEACELLQTVWYLPYQKSVIDPQSARTHFEIKYLARGELCQELVITKPDNYRTHFDATPAKWGADEV